jgi:hypothetical protein
MSRRILKEAAELQAAGLAETLIEKSEQLQPSLTAQKRAPIGPEPGLANSSVNLLSLCSGLLRRAQSLLRRAQSSAQSRLRLKQRRSG